jgi:hypothetical protein
MAESQDADALREAPGLRSEFKEVRSPYNTSVRVGKRMGTRSSVSPQSKHFLGIKLDWGLNHAEMTVVRQQPEVRANGTTETRP